MARGRGQPAEVWTKERRERQRQTAIRAQAKKPGKKPAPISDDDFFDGFNNLAIAYLIENAKKVARFTPAKFAELADMGDVDESIVAAVRSRFIEDFV